MHRFSSMSDSYIISVLEHQFAKRGRSLAHLFAVSAASDNDTTRTVVWNLNYNEEGELTIIGTVPDPNSAIRINGFQITLDGMTLLIDKKVAVDWGLFIDRSDG
jgi:hypothetical protein